MNLGNAIQIYEYPDEAIAIYSTTIHELAHAAHWDLDSYNYNRLNSCSDTFLGQYCLGDPQVAETWARGVQWALSNMKYIGYEGGNTSSEYTQLVVDLLDDVAPLDELGNPTDINNGSELLHQDNVSGYTIRQIEDALGDNTRFTSWKNSIYENYQNETRENLNALFDYWDNY